MKEPSFNIYSRPMPLNVGHIGVPEGYMELLQLWQRFKEPRTEEVAIDEYARHASLSTNFLEGVFALKGNSWARLIRRGFFVNEIEDIPRQSYIQDPEQIIRVLKKTDVVSSFSCTLRIYN